MTRVLMVCLGNICRSPLAHGILQSKLPSDGFHVDSAGTGNYHIGEQPDKRAVAVAKQYGIDISTQQCRQFQVSDFENFDIIFVMDASNFSNVVKMARNPNDIAKVKLILENDSCTLSEVPDPYYGDQKDFELAFNLLDKACDAIASKLRNSK